MSKILNYLFDVYAGAPNLLFWRLVMVGGGLAIIIGLAGLFLQKRNDKFWKHLGYRLAIWGFFTGPIIFLLTAFRFSDVYVLSMRLWIMSWLLFVALWLLRIVKWWLLDVPKARARRRVKQAFRKYLPG